MDAFFRTRCFYDFYLVLFLWNLGLISDTYSEGRFPDHMAKIKAVKDQVLKGYDKTIRPTHGESNTTEIKTAFIPRQIIGLDEEAGLLSLDSLIWLRWMDPRLKWNSSDYSGLLHLPISSVWLPDITVHNSHSITFNPTEEVLIVVAPSGQVYWLPPIFTMTTCATDPANYPYDRPTCLVSFGSWTHSGWEVDLIKEDHLYLDAFQNINPRWELVKEKANLRRNVKKYDCCADPYISLDLILPLKRRPVAEIEATRIPCYLTELLTLSIFWLPPDSTKKLLLAGILFLVLCVLLVYVAWSTRHPIAVLQAVAFIQSAMYVLVGTILLQMLVVTKLCSLDGPTRPPPAAMQLLNGPMGKWACLRSPLSEDNFPLDRIQLKEDCTANDSARVKKEWMFFATALDRVLFLIMTLTMVILHC